MRLEEAERMRMREEPLSIIGRHRNLRAVAVAPAQGEGGAGE
jgi:hypothetical protein